jgi:ABC-type polysaccharide/polyol phosphate transport system ATPase subunit
MAEPGGEVPVTDASIELRGVELDFPRVRMHSGGVKEAFLSVVTGRRKRGVAPFRVLRGIDLVVPRGEVLGLVGRNGSGKSTLLRVISKIYQPDRGVVTVRGRISALLELGAGFREELTGLENIKLSGAIMGLPPRQVATLIDPICDFADLGEFIEQPLRTYSSGMRARLGFAVATAVDPEILLVDEALSVGDSEFRERSMTRIEEMVRSDATVVIVSHNHQELGRLCSRLVRLDQGRIVADGSPEEVLGG